MITKEKIRGLFLGVAIGDAFGQPFESQDFETLKSVPRTSDYSEGRYPKGYWTDDTQLTIATANAVLEGELDMDVIARHHVKAFNESTDGWGSTTRNAIRNIAAGQRWWEAGKLGDDPRRGVGNGLPMKIAPVAAYFALTGNFSQFNNFIIDFTAMTHQTSVAVSSAFAHAVAILECLNSTPTDFDTKAFLRKIIRVSEIGRCRFPETLKDDLTTRLKSLIPLYETPKLLYDTEHLVATYSGGTCYVYNSLPFSYAFFIRGPFHIQTMFDVAYAGGDTDTNASIVAGLQGALMGTKVFPEHLYEGLKDKELILKLADSFYDRFCHCRQP